MCLACEGSAAHKVPRFRTRWHTRYWGKTSDATAVHDKKRITPPGLEIRLFLHVAPLFVAATLV